MEERLRFGIAGATSLFVDLSDDDERLLEELLLLLLLLTQKMYAGTSIF